MCHFQSIGRETGGVLVAFFDLCPPVTQVSGREHEPSKGQYYSSPLPKDQPQLKQSNKALIIKTPHITTEIFCVNC